MNVCFSFVFFSKCSKANVSPFLMWFPSVTLQFNSLCFISYSGTPTMLCVCWSLPFRFFLKNQKWGLLYLIPSGISISGSPITPLLGDAIDVEDSGYICIFYFNILLPFEENARIIKSKVNVLFVQHKFCCYVSYFITEIKKFYW